MESPEMKISISVETENTGTSKTFDTPAEAIEWLEARNQTRDRLYAGHAVGDQPNENKED